MGSRIRPLTEIAFGRTVRKGMQRIDGAALL